MFIVGLLFISLVAGGFSLFFVIKKESSGWLSARQRATFLSLLSSLLIVVIVLIYLTARILSV